VEALVVVVASLIMYSTRTSEFAVQNTTLPLSPTCSAIKGGVVVTLEEAFTVVRGKTVGTSAIRVVLAGAGAGRIKDVLESFLVVGKALGSRNLGMWFSLFTVFAFMLVRREPLARSNGPCCRAGACEVLRRRKSSGTTQRRCSARCFPSLVAAFVLETFVPVGWRKGVVIVIVATRTGSGAAGHKAPILFPAIAAAFVLEIFAVLGRRKFRVVVVLVAKRTGSGAAGHKAQILFPALAAALV
jgi:hypothetical protein